MGYRNLNSGNLRAQRRQQSRLATQAPVGGSSVGHGSGLRFYDGGELIIDGLNTGMKFRISESSGGISTARLDFHYEDMTNVTRTPLIWSTSGTPQLNIHGPVYHDSTGAEGLGGSHLQLGGRSVNLSAGPGGQSESRVTLTDLGQAVVEGIHGALRMLTSGTTELVGRRASLLLNSDGFIRLRNDQGHGLSVTSSGAATLAAGSTASIQGPGGVFFGTGDGGAGYNSHSDGRLYLGSSGNNIQYDANGALSIRASRDIQIIGSRRLDMWAPSGGQFNGDFTVAGSKNFIMDHPEKPGHTIKYAATESPVSGIEDRGRVTIGDDGTAEVVFPEHFTAIIKDNTEVDVFLQAYGPDPAWCDPPTREGTTIHGEPGTVVAWHALAERTGADFTVVEEGSIQTQPEPQPETEGQQWQQQQPSPQK